MLGTTALVLIFFLLRWSLDSYTFHDKQIEVPSLIGLDLEETQIVTAEQKLNWEVLDSSEYNYAFGDSEVWDQYPRAGSRVKEGRAIKLTVNPVREPMIQLPDLIEKPFEEPPTTCRPRDLSWVRSAMCLISGKMWLSGCSAMGKNSLVVPFLPRAA